jgi:hypothetical protein
MLKRRSTQPFGGTDKYHGTLANALEPKPEQHCAELLGTLMPFRSWKEYFDKQFCLDFLMPSTLILVVETFLL